jgi:hypothetical protein
MKVVQLILLSIFNLKINAINPISSYACDLFFDIEKNLDIYILGDNSTQTNDIIDEIRVKMNESPITIHKIDKWMNFQYFAMIMMKSCGNLSILSKIMRETVEKGAEVEDKVLLICENAVINDFRMSKVNF